MSAFERLSNIKRTLQVNILVAFGALLITTVLVIVTYTYQQNTAAVLTLADNLIDQINNTVLERTTNYLAPAAQMAQTSAQIPDIAGQSLVDNQALQIYGEEVIRQYPQLSGFFIGNESGDFIFAKRDSDGSVDIQVIDRSLDVPERTWTYRDMAGGIESVETTTDFTYDPRQRPWYIGAAESGNQYWTDIYIFFTDQKPGITAAYPIEDNNGDVIGVIGIDVALDELSKFLKTQKIGESGVAFIINEESELVAFPDIDLATAEGESFRPVQVSELENEWVTAAYEQFVTDPQERFEFQLDGQLYIASFTEFPAGLDTFWQIGVVVPRDDFVGPIKQTNQITLSISMTILALAILSVLWIARSISRPIVKLTVETDKIKSFDLDSTEEINSPIKEVQALSESVSSMRNSLRAFKKYVPAELVRQLMNSGEEAQLGGTKKEMTILFTDIIGFTALTEHMEPEALMFQLSSYLGDMATVVMENQGTVDKYMGDGIMAFWGAPLEQQDHANLACSAALGMRHALEIFKNDWEIHFPTRIGIHTGETLVGNMGSTERMNYTVVGDSVNLTSRLEGANNFYGTDILVSQDTYNHAKNDFLFRPLDIVTVKGRVTPVSLYELIGKTDRVPRITKVKVAQFVNGFDAYINQEWSAAQAIFEAILAKHPDDRPSQIYLKRCVHLQAYPPEGLWEPVTHLSAYIAN